MPVCYSHAQRRASVEGKQVGPDANAAGGTFSQHSGTWSPKAGVFTLSLLGLRVSRNLSQK